MREYLLTRGIVPTRCPWCRGQSSPLTVDRRDTFTLYTCNACPYAIKKIHPEDGIDAQEKADTYRRRHD